MKANKDCASFQAKFFTVLFSFPPAAGCTVVLIVQLETLTFGRESDLQKADPGLWNPDPLTPKPILLILEFVALP